MMMIIMIVILLTRITIITIILIFIIIILAGRKSESAACSFAPAFTFGLFGAPTPVVCMGLVGARGYRSVSGGRGAFLVIGASGVCPPHIAPLAPAREQRLGKLRHVATHRSLPKDFFRPGAIRELAGN